MFSAISDSVQAFEYNLGLIKRLFWYKLTVTLVSYYYELLKTNAHTKKGKLLCKITCIYSSQKNKFCTKYQQLKL